MDNVILVDWLTFTSKIDSISTLIDLLGLQKCYFVALPHGRNGYLSSITYAGITILFDGRDGMGICVDISGTGCRSYEAYSSVSWIDLFSTIICKPDYNVTRLDIAGDDFIGLLDIDTLVADTDAHNYVSRSKVWQVIYGSAGTTIYHGSKKSDIMIRIYDKSAEQKLDIHWIRVELQMRNNIAYGFIKSLMSKDLGSVFGGVLNNYLRYIVPSSDINLSRHNTASYWLSFTATSERIKVFNNKKEFYSFSNLSNFVINQAGNAISCYMDLFGVDSLVDRLSNSNYMSNPKYANLICGGFSNDRET